MQRLQQQPQTSGPWAFVISLAIIVLLGGGLFAYMRHSNEQERLKVERYVAEEKRAQEEFRAKVREAQEREQAAKDARDQKSEAEAKEFERILDENTQRALSGRKDFICQSCLGRGLSKDEGGQRVCQRCGGSGKTR